MFSSDATLFHIVNYVWSEIVRVLKFKVNETYNKKSYFQKYKFHFFLIGGGINVQQALCVKAPETRIDT